MNLYNVGYTYLREDPNPVTQEKRHFPIDCEITIVAGNAELAIERIKAAKPNLQRIRFVHLVSHIDLL